MFFQYMHNPINSLTEHTRRTVYTEPENGKMFLKYTLESNITPFLSTPYITAFNITQFQITDSNRYLAALLLCGWVKTATRSTKVGKVHKAVETMTMPLVGMDSCYQSQDRLVAESFTLLPGKQTSYCSLSGRLKPAGLTVVQALLRGEMWAALEKPLYRSRIPEQG